jgi:hypothetical protein
MTSACLTLALGAVALVASACAEPRKEPGKEPEARFGVFFGGQIQERREIPFELDRAKQALGFRVEFPAPLTEDVRVEWRITPPPPVGKQRAQGGAGAAGASEPRHASSDVARAGESRFERTTPLEAGDPLGMWNARVVAGGKVLVDRPFEVYDAAIRARAVKADGGF